MIYSVLGMHKSGTTLVAQILHHSGINMGDEIEEQLTYDQGNQYERDSFVTINQEILQCDGMSSIDIEAPDTLRATEKQRSRMRGLIHSCTARYSDWGFKDPRLCLTYPLWASLLPPHKLIAVYRRLDDIWPRYRSSNPAKALYAAWRLVKRWCEHNVRMITYVRETKAQALVLSYHRLMLHQEEFARLQSFVGSRLSDERDMQLYRSRSRNYIVMRMAEWLHYHRTGVHPKDIFQQLARFRAGCGQA